jgi:hypothetical protein
MDQAIMRRWKRHHCKEAAASGHVVRFNDWGAKVDDLPGITQGCPFCWTSYLTLRSNWWDAYRKRARVATPEEVGPVVAEMVRRLERPYWPRDGIINHFGPYASIRGLGVHVNRHDRRYLVVMSQSLYRRPAALHQSRAEAVASALGCSIIDRWNGHDNAEGVSVVLGRDAPDALHRALDNYRAMKNVFEPTDADKAGYLAFQRWYEAPFEEAA